MRCDAAENARHQSRKEALLTAKAEQLKTGMQAPRALAAIPIPMGRAPAWLTTRAAHACAEDGELRVDVADDYDVDEHAEIRYIKDGDTVKLLHVATNKLLNSHDVASAMNPSRQEVRVVHVPTGSKGSKGPSWIRITTAPTVLCVGPPRLQVSGWDSTEKLAGQTEWRIKVKKNKGNGILPFKYECVGRVSSWRAVVDIGWAVFRRSRTRFQLEHVGTNTLLELSGDKLPEWGFKQAEVVSSKVPVGTHTTWFIDKHINDRCMQCMRGRARCVSWKPKDWPTAHGIRVMAFAVPSVQSDAIPTLSYTEKLFELINEMTEANARLTSKVRLGSLFRSRRPLPLPFPRCVM
jgi:hypothetical protein